MEHVRSYDADRVAMAESSHYLAIDNVAKLLAGHEPCCQWKRSYSHTKLDLSFEEPYDSPIVDFWTNLANAGSAVAE